MKLISMIIALSFFSGCMKKITGRERTALITKTAPIARRVFEGYNKKDADLFTRDFDGDIKIKMPKAKVRSTFRTLADKIGAYQAHRVKHVGRNHKTVIIVYAGSFEKARNVKVKMIFIEHDNAFRLAGLWFDSAELRPYTEK